MRALLPFIKLFKQQWLMMFVGLVLSISTLMAGIGLLSLSGWFLSASAVAGLTLATAQAFNYFTPGGGVRFLSILRTASRYGERLATHEATFKLLTQLRGWAWRKVLPLSASNMQGLRHGDLLNRLVADIDTLDHLYLRLLTPMSAALVMLGALYFFVAWIDADIALILCGSLLLLWLILPWIFYFLGRKPGVRQLESKRIYRIQVLEFVQGLAEISLFGASARFRAKLALSEANLLDSQRAMANITASSQAALILCHGFVVVLVLYTAASGIGEHQPPGPMLALITFMVLASIEMLMPIAGAFQHLSSCTAAAERINELVEQEPDIVFNNQSEMRVTQGQLQLKDIVFSYQDGGENVLKGINLSIKPGEKVALLGQTGCGKSSLLSLISRERQADSGSLMLDGLEIEQYSKRALSDGISLVSQRIYLFSGTLRSNLILAQEEFTPPASSAESKAAETVNDQRLIAVLEKVGLSALTQGKAPLDAWIGEGGRQLSGGEQRRIGVARVLLRDAPLLLLDEPTEGLDKRTEREILSLLFEFAEDKSVLMISHRLTAMAQMDKIHLMEDGQLRVSGKHTDLLTEDDYYAGLYQQLN
ncbi:heme ABC transporter ATP-binding protein/permease CydC [Psychromonas aquimarina]|uniref:heme ABC transporter ATP-binding protein/permease CydC n=1 Tax=Psychromonas aquimarina TaxID=444919 RepID=UPI0003FEEBD5|nr:cysteine/glutathione ABC transporter ATP-binding protein/permease CydC [Psychromonas aquimarina]